MYNIALYPEYADRILTEIDDIIGQVSNILNVNFIWNIMDKCLNVLYKGELSYKCNDIIDKRQGVLY